MKILIVEDEKSLADILKEALEKESYQVDVSYDGESGEEKALTLGYDLILLDVMLPLKDGFSILKSLEKNKIKSKVIMLTARGSLEDKLEGLEGGAKDYITKPFHIEEVVARVNIQLGKVNNKMVFEDLELDTSKLTLSHVKTHESVTLVRKEFLLLEYFFNNPHQVLSKESIYEKIWGYDNESESNNLEAYLSFLRRKIKAINSYVTIKAVRGMGYKLEGCK